MHAESYPVTFGYGATDGQYYGPTGSVGLYHRGEDRAMPIGTPVLVNGIQIGLSGNTGASSGPHLHIGRFLGAQDTSPNGGGFHFNEGVITEISEDAINGKYVRIQAEGASWVYLHLSAQTAVLNQRLVENAYNPPPTPPYTVEQIPRKQVVIRSDLDHDAYRWDVSYGTSADVFAHALAAANPGDRFYTSQILHHQDGDSFYVQEDNVFSQPNGFKVDDCIDYVAPPPKLPDAPYTAPSTEQRIIIVELPCYSTVGAAQAAGVNNGHLQPGKYYVFNKQLPYYNLTTIPGQNQQQWINDDFNHEPLPEPVIEPPKLQDTLKNMGNWSSSTPVAVNPPLPTPTPTKPKSIFTSNARELIDSYEDFRDGVGKPVTIKYRFLVDYTIMDISGQKKRVQRYKNDTEEMAGTFISKGFEYLRPAEAKASGSWHGVNRDDHIVELSDLYQVVKTAEGYLYTEVKRINPNRLVPFHQRLFNGDIKLSGVWDVFKRPKTK